MKRFALLMALTLGTTACTDQQPVAPATVPCDTTTFVRTSGAPIDAIKVCITIHQR